MNKYTIKDFVNEDNKLIFVGNYMETEETLRLLRLICEFDDCFFENMITINDPVFRFFVSNNRIMIVSDDSTLKLLIKEGYKVIKFDELIYNNLSNKKFELEEVVCAELYNGILQSYQEFVTAYVSAIDFLNERCEVVYLHDVHKSIWIPFSQIHKIDSIYIHENEEIKDENKEK